jgi:ubiquinone/menaquinone biosynthesis C-methylase UbiE
MTDTNISYVLGRTDHEQRRLALQASLLDTFSTEFFRHAGISPGMQVLEVGCGVGDVSLIAAQLVGKHGKVHCLDIDDAAIETARGKIHSAKHNHVSFECGEVDRHAHSHAYDAVIGRHILIHMKDAQSTLQHLVPMVRPGGVVAFQEFDLSFNTAGFPETPLISKVEGLIVEFFRRATPRPNIGTQLFHLMLRAGLSVPECRAEHVIGGGPQSLIYEWIAETLRSLLPPMAAMGMTSASETYSEDLALRLREEAAQAEAVLIGPLMVGAFARKPS